MTIFRRQLLCLAPTIYKSYKKEIDEGIVILGPPAVGDDKLLKQTCNDNQCVTNFLF